MGVLEIVKKKGYTLKSFSEVSGISYDTLKKLNSDKSNPTIGTLNIIAKKLNCSIIDFFNKEDFENSINYKVIEIDENGKYKSGLGEFDDINMVADRLEKKISDLTPKIKFLESVTHLLDPMLLRAIEDEANEHSKELKVEYDKFKETIKNEDSN